MSSSPPPGSASVADGRTAPRARAPAPWLREVRANPSELLAQPLLLAAVLLAAGFAAMGVAAAAAARAEKRSLQSVADGAVATLEFALLDALSPLREVRDILENDSSLAVHSAARHLFEDLAPGLVASNAAIVSLQLLPYGRLAASEPLVSGSAADGTLLDVTAALGARDVLDGAATPSERGAAVLALSAQELVLLGPRADVLSCGGVAAGSSCRPVAALVAYLPIFVLTSSVADPWADSAWPAGGVGGASFVVAAPTNCSGVVRGGAAPGAGVSLCATNVLGDGRRFWGYICERGSALHALRRAPRLRATARVSSALRRALCVRVAASAASARCVAASATPAPLRLTSCVRPRPPLPAQRSSSTGPRCLRSRA